MSDSDVVVLKKSKKKKDDSRQNQKSEASRVDILLESLKKEGFQCEAGEPGALSLRFEGGTYFVLCPPEDQAFFHVVYPNFWELKTEEESLKALVACDAVNHSLKLVKLHLMKGDMWASVESLHDSPQQFMAFLPIYLGYIQEGVRAFRDVMLSEEE